jgi:hypothetical protein
VYSPALDRSLSLAVLGPQPVVVAMATAETRDARDTRQLERAAITRLDSLYLELARRSKAAAQYPEAIGAERLPALESFSPESLSSLIAYGKTVFGRVERSAQELICGDSAADQADRQQIQRALLQAARIGPNEVASVLAGFFAMYLYLIPPINQIAARIIVEKVLAPIFVDAHSAIQPTVAKACQAWAVALNQRYGAIPPPSKAALAGATRI